MGRARRAWLLGLAALSLLWACCHVSEVMAQGARRTADLRSGLFEPPPEPAPAAAAARAAPAEALIPEKSLFKIFERGGVLMWPLLLCSIVMMVFVFERAICLRRGNILPRPFVTRFLLQVEDG